MLLRLILSAGTLERDSCISNQTHEICAGIMKCVWEIPYVEYTSTSVSSLYTVSHYRGRILIQVKVHFPTVLRIHEILERIRIRGSIPLNNGSGSRFGSLSCYFVSDLQDANKSYFAYYFLKVHLHHFLMIKSRKEVTKQ